MQCFRRNICLPQSLVFYSDTCHPLLHYCRPSATLPNPLMAPACLSRLKGAVTQTDWFVKGLSCAIQSNLKLFAKVELFLKKSVTKQTALPIQFAKIGIFLVFKKKHPYLCINVFVIVSFSRSKFILFLQKKVK